MISPILLHIVHGILGDNFVVLPAVEGQVLDERFVGDDDSGGVGGGVAGKALEREGEGEQILDLLAPLHQFAKPRLLLERVGQGYVEHVRV